MNAVTENYDQLQELWEWSLQNSNDTETKARIRGVSVHTKTFAFCFGIHVAHLILGHSDDLSRALQSAKLSANEAQEMARCNVMVLGSLRTEGNFKLFYKTVTNFAKQHDAGQASLPRKRKAPSKIIFGKAPHENPETPAGNYRVKFFEALDLVINCIEDRFNQKDYHLYATCEQLLIKAVKKEDFSDDISEVMDFYNDDFNAHMTDNININSFKEIRNQAKLLSSAKKALISDVIKLLKLLVDMPATNAVSERSFSAMRRLYTYTRTNMSQNRLNHMMILHVHKTKTDSLSLINIANEFVKLSDHRLAVLESLPKKIYEQKLYQ